MLRSRVTNRLAIFPVTAISALIACSTTAAPSHLPTTRFSWPLALPFGDPHLRIAEYVDDDPSPVSLADYTGGNLTYEGHRGTDFAVNSFRDMDAGVPVLAPANGQVLSVEDGQYDRQISLPPVLWNYVVIAYADGTFTVCGHLRKNSVAVQPGEYVREGQIIGMVGSSGSTWLPHLHFEAWKYSMGPYGPQYDGTLDPWAGTL